jgi:hypothetical protein
VYRIDFQKWRLPVIAGLLVLVAAIAAGIYFSPAGPVEAKTFATPDEATKAFVAAARTHDIKGLETLLGPDSKEALESGDPVEDRAAIDKFLAAYDMKSMLVQDSAESTSWHVGSDDWTLPIPIVMRDGRWQFDPDAGYEEIVNRRIGRNEANTIEAALAYVDAQREYAMIDRNGDGLHEYAQRFISTPGKQDGLYWPEEANLPPSPLGSYFAEANAESYLQEAENRQKNTASDATPPSNAYYGYIYKILTSQGADAKGGALDYMVDGKFIGGFGLVAYPADYGVSGIMTFMVNHEGEVYQKDLGPDTESIAEKITAYNPDSTWQKAEVPTN